MYVLCRNLDNYSKIIHVTPSQEHCSHRAEDIMDFDDNF